MTGPLRAAAVVLALGFLVVWLIRPIGNPCPDRGALPPGSTKSSSPSFAPPGTRTCTYTTPEGTKATFHYVPWLDWIVVVLLAGLVAGAVRRAGRGDVREPRAPRAPRAPLERPPREPRAQRPPRPQRDRTASASAERDAAERERARQERAERARRQREG